MRLPRSFQRACSCQLAIRLVQKARRLFCRDGRYIVVTALPKSGSTFLTHTLAEVTGYSRCYFGISYTNVEQELYLPKMLDAYGQGSVVHQHFRANATNLEILSLFKARPIVLVRNVFDAAVSVRDHLIQESSENLPAVYLPPGYSGWAGERQFEYIVDFVMPWYLSFFASWVYAERLQNFPLLWMVYEEVIRDWPAAVACALRFSGIEKPREVVEAALTRVSEKPRERIRFNKGVVGRGEESLTAAQRKRVRELARHYPDVDFAPIGLSSA